MTNSSKNILVAGATGFLGSEICRQLSVNQRNVKAMVRTSALADKLASLKNAGVQMVHADLKDKPSLQKALAGIDCVISTASSTFSRQEGDSIQTVDREGQLNLVEAAIANGVKQFIFVSFPFTPQEYPLQAAKRQVEEKIKASGMQYTILKPSFFMEAWLSPAVGFDFPNAKATIYGDGTKKISWIAIQDVAAFAVAAVDSPSMKNQTIELGGAEALSPKEAVKIFEETFHNSFEVQHVPVEALQQQMAAASDDLSKSFSGLMLFYANGHEVDMGQRKTLVPSKMKSVQEHAAQMKSMIPA